ncbi:MAG: UvrD-helicase domain-containing protein [Bdellovibrionota bacterium]|nr:MAG: UvrD-helicase domain-containing protein [Bdellovibrionota bacterium]
MNRSVAALNPPQLEAVSHFEGPILVLAGAGSGKTRVLTHRVAHLVGQRKVSPQQILAVTFTNKATEEMRERLRQMLGEGAEKLWVATFHSAALRMLRRHANLLGYMRDFVVYDEDDAKSVMKAVLKESGIDEKRYPPQLFLRAIDQAKNSYIQPHQYVVEKNNPFSSMMRDVYEQYQTRLQQSNAMDFGDLLVNALRLMEEFQEVRELYQRQVRFLLVDEFQDTNLVQYLLIKRFVEKHHNLFVVGDDDQSIYRFRGATIRNILDFEKDFPKARVVVLDQNYRSSSVILDAANAVIAKNPARKPKRLWTAQQGGDPVQTYVGEDENDEARFITEEILQLVEQGVSLKDIAIFYRTNAQSRALEEALLIRRVPYRIFGGMRFYDRKEIRDIIGYLRLIVNEFDSQAFLRIINNPPRGIGSSTLRLVQELANSSGISLIEASRIQGVKHKGLAAFMELFDSLTAEARRMPLHEFIRDVVERSDYGPRLRAIGDPQSTSRQENIDELIGLAATSMDPAQQPWDNLTQFLDRVSLTSSTDIPSSASEDNETNQEALKSNVCLMTLHLAKGLEFPYVFFSGMEEGLLPHYRSLEEPQGVEEERRLCYVGITRAMKRLYISRALTRGLFSSGDSYAGFLRPVSRFAYDLPTDLMMHRSFDFLTGGYELSQFDLNEEPEEKALGDLVCRADELEDKSKLR